MTDSGNEACLVSVEDQRWLQLDPARGRSLTDFEKEMVAFSVLFGLLRTST